MIDQYLIDSCCVENCFEIHGEVKKIESFGKVRIDHFQKHLLGVLVWNVSDHASRPPVHVRPNRLGIDLVERLAVRIQRLRLSFGDLRCLDTSLSLGENHRQEHVSRV